MNSPGPRVKHTCPRCGDEADKVVVFHQTSYLGRTCRHWGPWRHRKILPLKRT